MNLGEINDTPAFTEARRTLCAELPEHMRTWSLAMMIVEVRRLINSEDQQNRVRAFSRRVLKLHGPKYLRVAQWLRDPSLLSIEDACLVLRALATETVTSPVIQESGSTELNRKLVMHTITSFNSLDMLTAEAGITSSDLFDGDRMQLQKAMERLCARFGMSVAFSDPSASRNQRVHPSDLN